MENKPLKRSSYMVALSRDHHVGLLFCWKIREGINKGASFDRITGYVRFFWEEHLREHFQEEEILLFNQHDDALTRRGKAEHVSLENLFRMITSGQLKEPNFLAFTEQLTAHIRFEERELFPFLEKTLTVPVLTAVRDILIKLHSVPFEDKYADEFWVN
jgi:hemerythrin-like domain-containing protein